MIVAIFVAVLLLGRLFDWDFDLWDAERAGTDGSLRLATPANYLFPSWSRSSTRMTPAPMDETLDADSLPESVNAAALKRMDWVASLLDDGVKLPVVNVRVGLDPLVGLLPVAGDTVAAIASLYLVGEAVRLGVRKRTLARMLANVGIDFAVGSIPLLGDLFDVVWRANRRNFRLVLDDLGVDA